MNGLGLALVILTIGCAAAPDRRLDGPAPRKASTPETEPEASHAHLPIGFANTGICIGNSRDWNGVRLNGSDDDLGTINGLNVPLWWPRGGAPGGTVNGMGLAPIGNFATNLHGAFVSLYANGARGDMIGVHVAGGANLALGDQIGLGGALFWNNSDGDAVGVHLGGLAEFAGGDATGIHAGGFVAAAARSMTGVNLALGGTRSGEDSRGLTVGGLFVGADRDLDGIQASLFAVSAARRIRGITLGGLLVSAGGFDADEFERTRNGRPRDLLDVILFGDARSEASGDRGHVVGITLAGIEVKVGDASGVAAAIGSLELDGLQGLGISLCTRIEKAQTGVTFGAFNHAETIDGFGFQLGLLNHIPTNPSWARWLPLVNWQM